MPIVNVVTRLNSMIVGNFDVSGCGINTNNACAGRSKGLADQAGTTTDVQYFYAFNRGFVVWRMPEVCSYPLDDKPKPFLVKIVNGAKFSIGVPPLICQCLEPLNLLRINVRFMIPRLVKFISCEHRHLQISGLGNLFLFSLRIDDNLDHHDNANN